MKQYDVLVIGGGAAGLMAALELVLTGKKVAVIEAKEKCGGRINSLSAQNESILELGAEFVHGDLPLTMQILKKAGIKTYEVNGSIWQKKENNFQEQEDFIEDFEDLQKKFRQVKADMPVKDFIDDYLKEDKYEALRFTLKNYVEGYYAADLFKASTYALCEELTKGDDVQYRVVGGYRQLINYLELRCSEKGVDFFLSQPALQLHWKKHDVEIITTEDSYTSKKVMVTVPIGVLQNGAITFLPSIPAVQETASQLGFGHVLKINFLFSDAFWKNKELTNGKDLDDLNFLFSEETIPTWWTQHPQKGKVLTGWLGGPKAKAMQTLTDKEIIQKALSSLCRIFNIDLMHLQQKLQETKFYNWSADPHFSGAYSYAVVNGKQYIQELLQPIENTIYFAGEGLHDSIDIGTVEAALVSGRDVAQRLIAEF